MPSVTVQKLAFIAFVVVFSATALGKSPFAGFPGGPSSLGAVKGEARTVVRYGWNPPKRTGAEREPYAAGMQVYVAPPVATMHDAWDMDVDY